MRITSYDMYKYLDKIESVVGEKEFSITDISYLFPDINNLMQGAVLRKMSIDGLLIRHGRTTKNKIMIYSISKSKFKNKRKWSK